MMDEREHPEWLQLEAQDYRDLRARRARLRCAVIGFAVVLWACMIASCSW